MSAVVAASHHLHIIDFLRIHFQIQLFAVRPATATVPLDQHPAARDRLHPFHPDMLLCGRSAATIRPRGWNIIRGASHSFRSRELLLITPNPHRVGCPCNCHINYSAPSFLSSYSSQVTGIVGRADVLACLFFLLSLLLYHG